MGEVQVEILTETSGEETISMCDVLDKMEAKGIAKSIAKGIAEGMAKERIKSAKDFIKAGLTTFEKIKNSGLYSEDELSAIASLY